MAHPNGDTKLSGVSTAVTESPNPTTPGDSPEGFNGMASAARGSADNYEATDEFLAASFGGTFHS